MKSIQTAMLHLHEAAEALSQAETLLADYYSEQTAETYDVHELKMDIYSLIHNIQTDVNEGRYRE